MSQNHISIPLSKRGKHAGKYKAIVDAIDAEFTEFNWYVDIDKYTQYAVRGIYEGGKYIRTEQLHRVIMEKMLGKPVPDGYEIDHKNGIGTDCRRDNLRLATRSQNQRNKGRQANNTSGYKGIYWHKQKSKWQAQIKVNGKVKYLGRFDTPEEAYVAYCEAADDLHKTFANYGVE